MDYCELPAPPPFDQWITCVWFLTGRGDPNSAQPVVPDGRLELLIHLGDPFSRLERDGSTQWQDRLLVAGQLTGPIHVVPGRWIDVVGVRLTPPGAHAILAIPLTQLSNQVVSLADVEPRVAKALEAAAARPGDRTQRARVIMQLLAGMVRTEVDDRMSGALRLLSSGYHGTLKSLAAHCGMSSRTLERRFLNEVGLSPKMYQRVVRFRRAFRMLGDETGARRWAQVAVRAGYYDQAHLIRDFREFAGASPISFFRSDPALAQVFLAANHGDTRSTKKGH